MRALILALPPYSKSPNNIWHPEPKERLLHIRTSLKNLHLWEKLVQIKPQKADLDYVGLVHAGEHVEKIRTSGEGCLDPDTYISNDSLEAALYAAGSIIEAVKRCNKNEVRRVFCAVRPPGHHAEADSAMGFCLLNNIAIGARYAQTIGYQKVLIIDFGAHHGNGTQHIFEEDDTVFYFSTHQYPHYPDTGGDAERGKGKGTGYTYNVQMLAGSGNKDYLYIYQDILPDLVRRFSPDFIFVSAGYDIHANDHHPTSGLPVKGSGAW